MTDFPSVQIYGKSNQYKNVAKKEQKDKGDLMPKDFREKGTEQTSDNRIWFSYEDKRHHFADFVTEPPSAQLGGGAAYIRAPRTDMKELGISPPPAGGVQWKEMTKQQKSLPPGVKQGEQYYDPLELEGQIYPSDGGQYNIGGFYIPKTASGFKRSCFKNRKLMDPFDNRKPQDFEHKDPNISSWITPGPVTKDEEDFINKSMNKKGAYDGKGDKGTRRTGRRGKPNRGYERASNKGWISGFFPDNLKNTKITTDTGKPVESDKWGVGAYVALGAGALVLATLVFL